MGHNFQDLTEMWKKRQLALSVERRKKKNKKFRLSLFHILERIHKNKLFKIPNASKFRINEFFSFQLFGISKAVFLKVDWLTICSWFIKQYLHLSSYLANIKNAPQTLKAPTSAPCLSSKKTLQIHFKQEMVVVVFNPNLKGKQES